MPSNKATAEAPKATGVLLAGTATREVAQHGLGIWTALGLAGGLSAVTVGFGVKTSGSGFGSNDDPNGHRERTTVALTRLALMSVAVSAGLALVQTTESPEAFPTETQLWEPRKERVIESFAVDQ